MTTIFHLWAEAQIEGTRKFEPSILGRLRSRAANWVSAVAKQVFPVVIMLAIFATLVAAIIAIRLAIWLPMYFH